MGPSKRQIQKERFFRFIFSLSLNKFYPLFYNFGMTVFNPKRAGHFSLTPPHPFFPINIVFRSMFFIPGKLGIVFPERVMICCKHYSRINSHMVSKKQIRRHVQGSGMNKGIIETIIIRSAGYRPAVIHIGMTGLGVEDGFVRPVNGLPSESQMPFSDASGMISRILEHSGNGLSSRFDYRFGKTINAESCFFGTEG